MKKSVLPVFLCFVLVITAVLGQIPPVAADAAGNVSNPSTDSSGTTTWDCIYFGKYWQNDTNGDQKADGSDAKEAIKWRVLSVKDKEAILMAEQCLDCLEYNEGGEDLEIFPATWETSSLRAWLNGTFYQNAFSKEEQSAIKTTTVVNGDNPLTGAEGGDDTQDMVYLLSIAEAGMEEYGFESGFDTDSETRCAKATNYANGKFNHDEDNASHWWLRSQGSTQQHVATIGKQGEIDAKYGRFNDVLSIGVRPVVHIDLSVSSVWENAGTVKAVKKPVTTEKPTPVTTKEPTVTKEPTLTPTKKPTATRTPTVTKKTTPTKRPMVTAGGTEIKRPVATEKPTPAPKLTEPPRKPAPATTMKPGTKKAISSFKDLQEMENIPSGNYYLKKDITVPKNTQLFCDYPFTGTLDGKGHKIKGYQFQKKYVLGTNMKKDKTLKEELIDGGGNDIIIEKPDAGIFGTAKNATFKNISVTNVNINVQTEGYAQVGALVSQTDNCTFTNVHSSGKISVRSTRESPLRYRGTTVGGIVGTGSGTLTKCSNRTKITVNCRSCYNGYGIEVGGLAGRYALKKMKGCTNSGSISLSGYAGGSDDACLKAAGLVGSTSSSGRKVKITDCTNSGKVTLKAQGGKKAYETLQHYIGFGKDYFHSAGAIQCGGVCAAGITDVAAYITSCGNTGKIQMGYNIDAPCGMNTGGLLGQIWYKASKCYNKGAIRFSGNAREDNGNFREGDEDTNVAGLFGIAQKTVTQCYNKGKVSANVTNKILGGIRVGGVIGVVGSYYGEVKNNYNVGTLYLKSKGGWIGGIAAFGDGGYAKSAETKYNYNAGKIKTKSGKNITKAAIYAATAGTEVVPRKRLVYHNYYKKQGSLKPYQITVSWKDWIPKAKKVSSITKKSCPKLSSKYWTYSGKVKRMVLKNNYETKKTKKKK